MSDRIEALERLQRLRESGAINEAEFEGEKAALFAAPPGERAIAAVDAPRGGLPRWLWPAAAAASVALLLVIAAIWLLSRDRGPEPIAAETDTPAPALPPAVTNEVAPAPGIRSRPEAEQLAAAFQAAFGRSDSAVKVTGDNTITYRPGRMTWIGDRAVLISPGRNSQDCHACAGTLAVHYLVPEGDGFRVVGEWLEGGGFADWGRPPEWRFSTALSSTPMLRTEWGGGNQGVFCSSVEFYEFAPAGPRKIAEVQTGYTNVAAAVPEYHDPPFKYEGEMRNIVRGRSFEMAYTITRHVAQGDEYVPAGNHQLVERYVLRGGRYVLASGVTNVPYC